MPPIHGNTTTTGENAAAALTGAELVRGVQAGDNVKMTTQAIADLYTPTSTVGDLIVRGASADGRLAVGADGLSVVADSTQPLGVKWAKPSPSTADLLSLSDATKGAGQIGAAPASLNYAAGTIGWADALHGMQLDWFYQVGDEADYIPAFNRACAALLLLVGPSYSDSMGQGTFGYGVSRRLCLAGRKYQVNSTPTFPVASGSLPTDISIYAFGGGFYPGPSFSAAGYLLDTGASPYGGSIDRLTIDGQGMNVKGILFRNTSGAKVSKPIVVNCANDGITWAAGSELTLSNFEVAGCATPVSFNVAGLRIQTSDGHFINGVCKFTPIGIKLENASANELVNVHCWGEYSGFQQYLSFYGTNSPLNTFTNCYADSPTKQDYTQDNIVTLNGIPNGGVGFYFDTTSPQNTIHAAIGIVNTSLWSAYAAAHSITGNHFYAVYSAGSFTNVTNLVYNYAGPWAGDVRWSSNAVRDSSMVSGTPSCTNGLIAARLDVVKTVPGAGVYQTVNNDDTTANANTGAFTQWVANGNTMLQWGGLYGAGGASSAYAIVNGGIRLQWSGTQALFSNSSATEGGLSYQFSDGTGSYAAMTLHRTGGASAPNAANASAKFGMTLVTSRSISAAGTINASGADYAEYENNGGLAIAKGDIVGFKADGTLTRTFAEAVRFGIKSTSPSYVGGDTWGTPAALGIEAPVAPKHPPPLLVEDPTGEQLAEQAALQAAYEAALAPYEAALAVFEAALEAARSKVDRVAYSGKVPVNVLGATSGQYIVPVAAQDGSIVGNAVSEPAFDQYVAAVGRVNRILPDGRAEVAVMVH